jgi:long-chain acyl-CoA synthetase
MDESLACNLTEMAARHPERAALQPGENTADQTTITYGQLDDATSRFAGLLCERGIGPGDRVAVMLPNVPEFVTAYYGALRAGAVVVPMNVLLDAGDVSFYLRDSGARLINAWQECAPSVRAGALNTVADCVVAGPDGSLERLVADVAPVTGLVERAAQDTAVIVYTSGDAGRPNGAELTHANLSINADVSRQLLAVGDEDVIFGALPLTHGFAQTWSLHVALSAGASLVLASGFEPGRALQTIARRRVTVFEGSPAHVRALIGHPDLARFDLSALRVCVSGGGTLADEVVDAGERALGCAILEGYGPPETSSVACFTHPGRDRRPGSIGTPVEGVEVRAVDVDREEVAPGDVGELAIRGHNVMKGYWKQPHATAAAIDADGWFYSGDRARIDEDGWVFIVDRGEPVGEIRQRELTDPAHSGSAPGGAL